MGVDEKWTLFSESVCLAGRRDSMKAAGHPAGGVTLCFCCASPHQWTECGNNTLPFYLILSVLSATRYRSDCHNFPWVKGTRARRKTHLANEMQQHVCPTPLLYGLWCNHGYSEQGTLQFIDRYHVEGHLGQDIYICDQAGVGFLSDEPLLCLSVCLGASDELSTGSVICKYLLTWTWMVFEFSFTIV